MPPITSTPWQRHVAVWQDCQRCPLCRTRRRVVLGKGSLPCDVLFVGEAPGDSEDVLGQPFKGPAGRDLDLMIKDAMEEAGMSVYLRLTFTNTLGCVPKDYESKKKRKGKEPLPNELEACRPRLVAFLKMAQPKLIICVGRVAESEILKLMEAKTIQTCPTIHIIHPAAILQGPQAAKSLSINKNIVDMVEAFTKLKEVL